MIEGPADHEIVSEDELRALLSDELLSPAPETSSSARVLFVARAGADAVLLRQRLEAAGATVAQVRNPFSALDLIRKTPPDAVVSDLEVWAGDGELLFDRLGSLPKSIPVLFLADSKGEVATLESRLQRVGAWGLLVKPVAAGDAETAARRLLDAAAGAFPGDGESLPLARPEGGEPLRTEAAPAPRQEAENDAPAGAEVELPWLRFHLLVTRALRIPDSPDERARSILKAARECFQPRAAGLTWRVGETPVGRFELGAGEPPGLIAEAAAAAARPAEPTTGDAPADIVLGPPDGPRLALLGLPQPVRANGLQFLDDIRSLLEQAFGP